MPPQHPAQTVLPTTYIYSHHPQHSKLEKLVYIFTQSLCSCYGLVGCALHQPPSSVQQEGGSYLVVVVQVDGVPLPIAHTPRNEGGDCAC